MKQSIALIILSHLLLTYILFGQETGVLFRWKTPIGDIWKTFGDVDFHQKYNGEIKNGKPNGYGILYFMDGKKMIGEWKNGKEWNTKNYIDGGFVGKWTKQLGTYWEEYGNGVTTDSLGNIFVTGSTGEGLDGNTNSGGYDIFLIKYDASGAKQWTKQLGTSLDDYGEGVTTDSSGNIYVTGGTDGGLDGNTNLGREDIFLAKYNSSGTKQWTKQLGTSLNDFGEGVTTDSSGNIYVTGYTNERLDGNKNSSQYYIFLVKYNSTGTKQWTKQLGVEFLF